MRRVLILLGLIVGTLAVPASVEAAVKPSFECPIPRATDIVVCVDTSSQTAALLSRDGVVVDLGTVTTSRIDSDCRPPRVEYVTCGGVGDHITPAGTWEVTCLDVLTGTRPDPCNPVSDGLRNLVQFPNGTAFNTSVHEYRSDRIGRGWDSHGCVRVKRAVWARAYAIISWWAGYRVGRVLVTVKL